MVNCKQDRKESRYVSIFETEPPQVTYFRQLFCFVPYVCFINYSTARLRLLCPECYLHIPFVRILILSLMIHLRPSVFLIFSLDVPPTPKNNTLWPQST